MSHPSLVPNTGVGKRMCRPFPYKLWKGLRLQYSAREMDETLMKKRLKLCSKLIIHG